MIMSNLLYWRSAPTRVSRLVNVSALRLFFNCCGMTFMLEYVIMAFWCCCGAVYYYFCLITLCSVA